MQTVVAFVVLICLLLAMAPRAVSQPNPEVQMPATAPSIEQRTAELQKLRFGMFICWSFSTFSGYEWSWGVKDVGFFNPTGCDVDQWVRTAREAEMGYILFLTKHHDGFCLWDTKTTDRKVTRSPLGIDVLAKLRQSCDRHGVRLALYFSEGEFAWQDGGKHVDAGGEGYWRDGRNPAVKQAQLRELLTNYGPIEYIWFDHAIGDGGLDHAATAALVKSIQPGCFVGFNHGPQDGADIRLGEMGRPAPLDDDSAQAIGAEGRAVHMRGYKGFRLAEFTYPIQPKGKRGAMWFYSLPENEGACHPAAKLFEDYLGAARYGNVFALNVGPDRAGRIREIDVRTLREVGELIRTKAPAERQ
jgi:alpha-L-fucosidase